jgi:hypothetical protein
VAVTCGGGAPRRPAAHWNPAMEWIPVFLVTFKLLVFGIGMFFAIKWHYDQGKK